MRSASSRAMSRGVRSSGDAGVRILSAELVAASYLTSDSMSRYVVGNQTGPRQFEFPPLIFTSDSAGSYRTSAPPKTNGWSLWYLDRLRRPALDRNSPG